MMTNRPKFERSLQELKTEVVELGELVNKALQQAIAALNQRNFHLSRFVIENDPEINRRRFVIEEQALTLIATQQPVLAHDLRMVASIMSIAGELERMGDHARGIARINILLGNQPGLKLPAALSEMAEICQQMLDNTLKAFVSQSSDAALKAASRDDELDTRYDQIYHELLASMLKDPATINEATYLLWAAHNLERFGDRLTNICERIIFIATGQMREINRHREDRLMATLATRASARQELED